jgi:hypothetical protein
VNGSNLRKEILKTVRSYVGNIIYSVNISWQMTDRLEMCVKNEVAVTSTTPMPSEMPANNGTLA